MNSNKNKLKPLNQFPEKYLRIHAQKFNIIKNMPKLNHQIKCYAHLSDLVLRRNKQEINKLSKI